MKQFGRKITVIIGSGGRIAALVFLLGALVFKEWIKPTDGQWFIAAIKAAYSTYGLGFWVLVLGSVGLLIMHERLWLLLLNEKNNEIERIVEQRNRLEEIVLGGRGSSSPPPAPPKKKK